MIRESAHSQRRVSQEIPTDALQELRILQIWPDIEKIVERFKRFTPEILKDHPIYGQVEDSNDFILMEDIADVFVEEVLPGWNPGGEWGFALWFKRHGYTRLRDAASRLIERSDLRLLGMYDHRSRRWQGSREASFTIDEHTVDKHRFTAGFSRLLSLPPKMRYWRTANYWCGLSDVVTAEEWRRVLREDEIDLMIDFLSTGSMISAALNAGLSASWVRRKIIRICKKAESTIRHTIDVRLGLSDTSHNRDWIPYWSEAERDLHLLMSEFGRTPYYAQSRRKPKAASDTQTEIGWGPPISPHDPVWKGGSPEVSEARREWGLKAAERDFQRNQRLERQRASAK